MGLRLDGTVMLLMLMRGGTGLGIVGVSVMASSGKVRVGLDIRVGVMVRRWLP